MIELQTDRLAFSFPEVHPQASVSIDLQRTMRIPDDDKTYPLPPGLGRFPLRHVDDFASQVPANWLERGGVMLPMYQSEALWLNFHTTQLPRHQTAYPFAIKVAAGKINAVTGEDWSNGLHRRPQDYLVVPGQPWLDGYCVTKGVIRQFVAMPLGSGYSVEEQITGRAEYGGLQVFVMPMRRDVFERRFPEREPFLRARSMQRLSAVPTCAAPDMGLAPGGRMKQDIYTDPFELSDWDTQHSSRCFVHIANSLVWRSITGQDPPTTPPTAAEYTRRGLPWFDYYDETTTAVEAQPILQKIKSIVGLAESRADIPLPENEPVDPDNVVKLRRGLREGQVREGAF